MTEFFPRSSKNSERIEEAYALRSLQNKKGQSLIPALIGIKVVFGIIIQSGSFSSQP